MRRKGLMAIAAGMMLPLAANMALAAATQTLTGTIGDAMCGKAHTMGKEGPAECTRECVKAGSDYALIVGDKVYTLKGDKTKLDKMAGEKVTVKGTVQGKVFTAEMIEAAK